jgi:hypothetical protein
MAWAVLELRSNKNRHLLLNRRNALQTFKTLHFHLLPPRPKYSASGLAPEILLAKNASFLSAMAKQNGGSFFLTMHNYVNQKMP